MHIFHSRPAAVNPPRRGSWSGRVQIKGRLTEGQAIDTEHPLDAVLSQFAPGQTISVTILRNGSQQKVSVTLGTRPANLG